MGACAGSAGKGRESVRMTQAEYDALLSRRKPAAPPKPSKYRAQRVTTEDGTFDSKWEYSCWCRLKMEQGAGLISGLQRQVSFELIPAATLDSRKLSPVRYVADFVYMRDGKQVVEDAKGMASLPDYKLKRRLMYWIHGIRVIEIRK